MLWKKIKGLVRFIYNDFKTDYLFLKRLFSDDLLEEEKERIDGVMDFYTTPSAWKDVLKSMWPYLMVIFIAFIGGALIGALYIENQCNIALNDYLQDIGYTLVNNTPQLNLNISFNDTIKVAENSSIT